MRDLDNLFMALERSPFRSRFRLGENDLRQLRDKGMPTLLRHAADFVAKRLASARPLHDGKQTPMRGHPVFVAQHATATCCRGCLEKWHQIPRNAELTTEEQAYVVNVIHRWLRGVNAGGPDGSSLQPELPLE